MTRHLCNSKVGFLLSARNSVYSSLCVSRRVWWKSQTLSVSGVFVLCNSLTISATDQQMCPDVPHKLSSEVLLCIVSLLL